MSLPFILPSLPLPMLFTFALYQFPTVEMIFLTKEPHPLWVEALQHSLLPWFLYTLYILLYTSQVPKNSQKNCNSRCWWRSRRVRVLCGKHSETFCGSPGGNGLSREWEREVKKTSQDEVKENKRKSQRRIERAVPFAYSHSSHCFSSSFSFFYFTVLLLEKDGKTFL